MGKKSFSGLPKYYGDCGRKKDKKNGTMLFTKQVSVVAGKRKKKREGGER